MTELEKLIEQKKEIERRIKQIKDQVQYFGEDKIVKVDKYQRCAKAKEMFRVSITRMSYNDTSDGRYVSLIDVPMEDKDIAIDYLLDVNQALSEYLKESGKDD